MSVGSANFASPSILDVGPTGTPQDNTFVRTDTTANAWGLSPPWWSAFWVWQAPASGGLTLDASGITGSGDLDANLQVYQSASGSAGGFGSPVGTDNNSGVGLTPRLTIGVTAGTWYLIQIGSDDIGGNGIGTYHLSAELAEIPVLPNPRMYEITDGELAPPGGETSGAVVPITPNSVSYPSSGIETELWWTFTNDQAFDLRFSFDVQLSYAFNGECDEFDPEVGITAFHPDLSPFSGASSTSTDEFGRLVPRGYLDLYVAAGQTIYVQAYSYGSVPTRIILRVSDYGPHTDWLDIPDQQWLSDIAFHDTPVIWGPVDTPYIRSSPDPTSASFEALALRGPEHWQEFQGARGLQKGFDYTQIPGTDPDALDCAWNFARQGHYSIGWWTDDGTGTSVGPSDPNCVPPTEVPARDDGGGAHAEVPLGWKYDSTALVGVIGGGTQTMVWDCYAQAYRAHLSDTLGLFGATAGADIDDVPYPEGYDQLVYENDVRTAPDLLSIDWAWEQTASSTTSGVVHPHMAARAVSWDNSDGSWDQGLAPDDTTPAWHGIDAAEGQLTDDGSLSAWVELDPATVTAAMANEAAYVTDGATTLYDQTGGVLIVAYPQEQLSATRPAAGGLDTTVYSSYDHTYPRLRWNLAATTRYRYLGPAPIPTVEPIGPSITGEPGPDRTRFFS
jgi:hypothetical protein